MKQIRCFYNILFKIEDVIGALTLVAMAITVILQVFTRYVLNDPLVWTEEASRFLFIWMIMIGAGHSLRREDHVRVEIFADLLPKTIQNALNVAITLVAMVVFAMLLPATLEYAKAQHRLLSTALSLPFSYVYGSVFVGCILMELHLLEKLLNIFFKLHEKEEA